MDGPKYKHFESEKKMEMGTIKRKKKRLVTTTLLVLLFYLARLASKSDLLGQFIVVTAKVETPPLY
jgi:hypothetical protein